MRLSIVALITLAALPAAAQKPWETRVDLSVPVPIELPAIPPTNPFAAVLSSPATYATTPLREKFNASFTVIGASYVDSTGACRRVVFTRLPLPGLGGELQQALIDTDFTPAGQLGTRVATWLPFSFELAGRIKEGSMIRLTASPPDPGQPPVPDSVAPPTPDERDLALPAVPVERLDQAPTAKRFRARVSGRTWTQKVRMLAEVSPEGRCTRVVFLSCPEGLHAWLLASLGSWTFHPGQGAQGPVSAWVDLDGELEVAISGLESEALRVLRASVYPRAGAAAVAAPPPGG